MEERARQHSLWAGKARYAERRTREAHHGFHRTGRTFRFRRQLSLTAVWRHEAAHGNCTHTRLRPQDIADGRAVRRTRRADTRPDAERIAAYLAAHSEDGDFRHSWRTRSGLSR